MAHAEKFKRAGVFAVIAHCERNSSITLSNQNINKDLSHLNYNLFEAKHTNQTHEYVFEKMKELSAKRKDIVAMVSWIVTLPKEVKEEDTDKFFKIVFDYLINKYGEKNTVGAFVHKDETTPHLHFLFLPIIEHNGKEKFRCKDIINRANLKSFHADLNKHVSTLLGYECGIFNGITEEIGEDFKSVHELKKANVLLNKKHNELKEIINESIKELNNIIDEKELIDDEINEILQSNDLVSEVIDLKQENTLLKRTIQMLENIIHEILDFLEEYGFNELRNKILRILNYDEHNNDYER